MSAKYHLGNTFGRAARLSYGLTVIICIQGAFIYNYLFPKVPVPAVAVMFLMIAVICAAAEKWAFDHARKDIYYFLSEKGLLVHGFGDAAQLYPYDEITEVFEERFVYNSVCNVRFRCGEKVIKLNRYLDDPCGLALEIIKRLPDTVPVDPSLIRKLEALSGITA